ncbi:phosphocholine-specific phospholipase C [Streptomyces sp. NPDC127166]|uniref:phosphocholine-specific phospholipase C n=1 Tax=Streptomyces sp. NPDC127166 TaxID=3345380 RepID=UPI0036364646
MPPSPDVSRRALLGGAAGAAVLASLPFSVREALAAPARPGRLEDIEHVVVLMQENRSFDHYFGTLPGVRGIGDRTAVRGVNGRSVFHQPDPSRPEGHLVPFAMNAAHTNAYRNGAPAFGFVDSFPLWNDGRADGYVTGRTSGWLGHGFYEPADMPFYNALASTFTVCDQYHASVQCNTNTNRDHFMTGTSGGTVNDTVVYNNSYIPGGYTWTTYAERLQSAGVSWKTYQARDNYDDNALAWFRPFQQAKPGEPLHDRGMAMVGAAADQGNGHKMGDALVEAFRADVAADRLPQVSWIVAPEALSEHASWPPPYGEHLTARLIEALADHPEVWAKTVFILNYDEHGGFFDHCMPPVPPLSADRGKATMSVDGEVVVRVKQADGAIAMRVVSQDGRYRVRAADGSLTWSDTLPAGETRVSGPHAMGLGLRVPMLVVSPWTRGGVVDSTVLDHTSVIRFLERRFGVREPNISAWRRSVSGDLTSVFDFSGEDIVWPELPDTSGNVAKADAAAGKPSIAVPSLQFFPRQQRGTRPARPVPYALSLRSRVRDGKVELDLRNKGRQAAVFQVYAEPGSTPDFYTVGAGERLPGARALQGDTYDLRIHGPNGSLWALRGGADDALEARLKEESDDDRAYVEIEIENRGRRSRTVLVGDLAYGGGVREVRVGARDERTVKLRVPAERWYDIAVSAADDPRFLRRFAGRFADRQQDRHQGAGRGHDGGRTRGVTDPAMGLAEALTTEVTTAAGDEPVVAGGTTARFTVTVTNRGPVELDDVTVALTLPSGWTAKQVADTPPRTLASGSSYTSDWDVTTPADAPAYGSARLLAVARGRAADGLRLADGEIQARIAPSMTGHLLAEDFQSLAGKLVKRGQVLGWTATAPEGWSVVNAAAMPQGTPMFQGWTFHTRRAWSAGAQNRPNFTRGLGIVAVADPDDWDDTGAPASKGRFDSTLVSPAVPIPAGRTTLRVDFDSHYRQEGDQKAEVRAVFDTGEEQTVLRYGPGSPDAENTGVGKDLTVPAGARTVTLRFRMYDAGNNWYWAVDHIRLS